MSHTETQLSTERLYEGRIINLRRDIVRLEDGAETTREVVEHPGGVAVVAVDEDENLLMVRQFRYPMGREMLEIPAGKLNKGEDPAACGLRELEEETGLSAGDYRPFGAVVPTPAYVDEVIHLYLAKELRPGRQNLDPGEFLTVRRVPLGEAVRMCLEGEIIDAKTVAGVLKYYALHGRA